MMKGLMKRNAILVASIMFVAAGCATNDRAYQSARSTSDDTPDIAVSRSSEMMVRTPYGEPIPPSDSRFSAEYDPAASGGFAASASGSSSDNQLTSVDDYHADSSVRGGSNEARGVAREHLGYEGAPSPMDPSTQADSSLRGGSAQARQQSWTRSSQYEPTGSATSRSRAKANSSIRGGSNEARYGRQSEIRSNYEGSRNVDQSMPRDDFGQGSSTTWPSDKSGSLRGSANWNPSDDLLPDGTMSADSSSGITQNDASISGAAESASGDLNASSRIEQNIAGEYDLDAQAKSQGSAASSGSASQLSAEVPSDSSFSSDSVGGPGSTQTGVSSSLDSSNKQSTPLDVSAHTGSDNNPTYLFRDNRAQGVGSAASGEFAAHHATQGSQASGGDLAQRVKSRLTEESTGTHGMMPHDVARNVQVSSDGSGKIILKGTVSSERNKQMIEVRAREMQGVQDVENQLSVSPTIRRDLNKSADDNVTGQEIGRD